MFILGCKFTFKAYAKNVTEKTTKRSLKTVDGHVLCFIFLIVQKAPNCFKSHTNSCCPDFFQKYFLSDLRSEIHLVRRNIVSTGKFVHTFKNIYIYSDLHNS